MRMIFGLLGLVVVLAIVASLGKKQLGAAREIKVPEVAGTVSGTAPPSIDPKATVQQQSQQIQQQYKQAIEGALQQSRPMPEDK